jgi:hypothetical protein
MILFYLFLLAILLATYGFALTSVKRRSDGLTPLLGWLMGLGFFLLGPLTLLTLHGGYEMPPSEGITEAWTKINLANPVFFRPYLVIWLSMMLICTTVFLAGGAVGSQPAPTQFISYRKLERVILLTMAISIAGWVTLVWLVGGVAEFVVSHWYLRAETMAESLGGYFTLYARILLANQLLFTGAAALHTGLGLRDRRIRWRMTSLILLFLLIEMVMSGNRIFIAFYLLALVASSWLNGRRKLIAAVLVSSPLLVLVFSAWGAVRHDLSTIPDSVTASVIEADVGDRALYSLMHATEGGAVMLLMHIVNDFGGKFDYLHGSTYGRLLTCWVPRSVYPSRPLDFTNQAATFYMPGETTSLCATALGEAYANFGPLSIFVLPLFTWGVVKYTNVLAGGASGRPLMSAVSFVILIWFARCTFAENVINLLGAATLIWALKLETELCALSAPAQEQPGDPADGSSLLPRGAMDL